MNQKTPYNNLNLLWQAHLKCSKTHTLILKSTRQCEQLSNKWILNLQPNPSQLQTGKLNTIGITHPTSLNFQKRISIHRVKSNLKSSNKNINDVLQKQNSSQSLIDWWKRRRSMTNDESNDKENRLNRMNWDWMLSLELQRGAKGWLLTWIMSRFSSSIE